MGKKSREMYRRVRLIAQHLSAASPKIFLAQTLCRIMLKVRQQASINAALANVPFGETACSGMISPKRLRD